MEISDQDKLHALQVIRSSNTINTKLDKNDRVLLVDGTNTFIRSFEALPTMNDNGLHIGGITGFLKSVGSAVKLLHPSRVIIIFDGEGGSLQRRKLYPEYKNGRRNKLKLNRTYAELTNSNIENKNYKFEFARLLDYIKILPVSLVIMNQIEADDVIAYLSKSFFKDSKNVYIMSTDKDFLQLVDDKIKVWSPTKKKLYGCEEIRAEYGIYCNNFIYYRILEGDVSDNIPGVKGAGLKTVKKAFPFMTESAQVSIDNLFTYSENNISKYKIYENIIENKLLVERNYKLMQLQESIINPLTQVKINNIVRDKIPIVDTLAFNKLICEDRMYGIFDNYMSWINDVWRELNYYC